MTVSSGIAAKACAMVGGSAEKLYMRLGRTRAGVIPNYALFPDGTWSDTTIFWKQLF